jgi:hypothetical protein
MRNQCKPQNFFHINSPCKYAVCCSRNRHLLRCLLRKNSLAPRTVDTRK